MVDDELLTLLIENNLTDCSDLLWRNGFDTLSGFSRLSVKNVYDIGFSKKESFDLLCASQTIVDKDGDGIKESDKAGLIRICEIYGVPELVSILPKYGIKTISDLKNASSILEKKRIPKEDNYQYVITEMGACINTDGSINEEIDPVIQFPINLIDTGFPNQHKAKEDFKIPVRIVSEKQKSNDSKQVDADKRNDVIEQKEVLKEEPLSHNMSYCPYCGNKLQRGAVFCSSCGKKLRVEEKKKISIPLGEFIKRRKKEHLPLITYDVCFDVDTTIKIPYVCPVCLAQTDLEPMYFPQSNVTYSRGVIFNRHTIYKHTTTLDTKFFVCGNHMQNVIHGFITISFDNSTVRYSFLNERYANIFASANNFKVKETRTIDRVLLFLKALFLRLILPSGLFILFLYVIFLLTN